MNQNWEKEPRKAAPSAERAMSQWGLFCVRVFPKPICLMNSWFSGDFRVVLYEKSCILPSMCGVTGQKYTMGINFTFTNECCNTHLCNGAAIPATPYWTATLLTLLISYSVWWIEKILKQCGRELVWHTLFCPLMDWHCTQLPFSNCALICALFLSWVWDGKVTVFSDYC